MPDNEHLTSTQKHPHGYWYGLCTCHWVSRSYLRQEDAQKATEEHKRKGGEE